MDSSARLVRVSVKAGARRENIKEGAKGVIDIAVKEPAQDGRANARVCELIAAFYAVSRRSVRIVAGQTRARKRVSVGYTA